MSDLDKRDRFALTFVLAAFTLSQPVLDLLGDNAEFFLSRRAPRLDIILTAVVVALGVPLVTGLLAVLPTRPGLWLFTAIAWVLSGMLLRLFLTALPLSDWWVTGISLTLAGVALAAYSRSGGIRLGVRYLTPAPLLFLALFFAAPSGSVVAGGSGFGQAAAVDAPAPLVWIVFDEFPAASLMDGAGNLHAERYPNFGRLAEDAMWFPNAATVQQQTEYSVPAILTGVQPSVGLTPFARQYPDNAFTMLAESHDLVSLETITHLCPASLCPDTTSRASAAARASALGSDVSVVAGHVLLPNDLTESLPPIDEGWGFFGRQIQDFDAVAEFWEAFDSDPRTPLRAAAQRLDEPFDGRPPFLFVHALVPHHPWRLLPTGQRYIYEGVTPGTTPTGWGDNEWLVAQGLQRHLLSVGYADHALGQILDAMTRAGIYEEAMIVVVADHGIAVRANVEHQRDITEDTVGEIAAVPLFVKVPGTGRGAVDHRRALTTDIVPTIADVMGIDLSWETDGGSLLDPDPERVQSIVVGPNRTTSFSGSEGAVRAAAARVAEWFPDADLYALAPPDAPDIYGQRLDVSVLAESGLEVTIDDADRLVDVDPAADGIPARVTGVITGPAAAADTVLAVIVNGTVRAVTATYGDGDQIRFQAMIPPDAFIAGLNEVLVASWDGAEFESVRQR